jgi:hypothetical protein
MESIVAIHTVEFVSGEQQASGELSGEVYLNVT